jgi:hypothetical protein
VHQLDPRHRPETKREDRYRGDDSAEQRAGQVAVASNRLWTLGVLPL